MRAACVARWPASTALVVSSAVCLVLISRPEHREGSPISAPFLAGRPAPQDEWGLLARQRAAFSTSLFVLFS